MPVQTVDATPSKAEKVRLKLTPEEQLRLHQAPEVNPEAYEAYLLAQRPDQEKRQGIETAKSYYEYAIQKDPGFALAYMGLARTIATLPSFAGCRHRMLIHPPCKRFTSLSNSMRRTAALTGPSPT